MVLEGFRGVVGTTPELCMRNDLEAGDDTGTIVHIGVCGSQESPRMFLLVEQERFTGTARNTERYMQLVPLPDDPRKREEPIVTVANAFSFQERQMAIEVLTRCGGTPDEVSRLLANMDRRTVQNITDVERALAVLREKDARKAAERPGIWRQLGATLHIIKAPDTQP